MYFGTLHYFSDQAKQLIQKGFNAKVYLYMLTEHKRQEHIILITRQLGDVFTLSNFDFWFTFNESKCDPTCSDGCRDKKARFIQSHGFRVAKKRKLGKGEFGSVYEGRIHGTEIGAKFIDVTSSNLAVRESAKS